MLIAATKAAIKIKSASRCIEPDPLSWDHTYVIRVTHAIGSGYGAGFEGGLVPNWAGLGWKSIVAEKRVQYEQVTGFCGAWVSCDFPVFGKLLQFFPLEAIPAPIGRARLLGALPQPRRVLAFQGGRGRN